MTARNNAAREIARTEAASWYVRIGSDAVTEQDWLSFEQWMATPANKAAYDALEITMLGVEDRRDALARALALGAVAPKRSRPLAPAFITALAAAGLAVVALGVLAPPKPQEFAYDAPVSATRVVTLPDNTVVRLNRGASVRVKLSAQSRQVVLARGEASFDVHHDAARPFAVVAGNATIQDIGTEFDVVHAPRYVLVTVREGRVAVAPIGGTSTALGAGEQGRIDPSTGAVAVATTQADDAFGWQSGRLIYHDASLVQIVEDLNRYSQTPIVIADDRAKALRFTGVLIIDDPVSMTRRLEAFLPIQSAQDTDRIVLRSRP